MYICHFVCYGYLDTGRLSCMVCGIVPKAIIWNMKILLLFCLSKTEGGPRPTGALVFYFSDTLLDTCNK